MGPVGRVLASGSAKARPSVGEILQDKNHWILLEMLAESGISKVLQGNAGRIWEFPLIIH